MAEVAIRPPSPRPLRPPHRLPLRCPASIIGDRSVNESATFEPFPQGAFVPADLKAAIDAKRPTLIYFYDSSYTSDTSRDIIDTVRDDNRGSIDLFAYDIAKYTTTSPQGVVSVDPALATDPAASQAVQLARRSASPRPRSRSSPTTRATSSGSSVDSSIRRSWSAR